MATNWAGHAEAYDTSFGILCAGAIPYILERTKALAPGSGAIDVGTGTGTLAAALAD